MIHLHYCTDLLIFNQIIMGITAVLMYNKRNGDDSYGKNKAQGPMLSAWQLSLILDRNT